MANLHTTLGTESEGRIFGSVTDDLILSYGARDRLDGNSGAPKVAPADNRAIDLGGGACALAVEGDEEVQEHDLARASPCDLDQGGGPCLALSQLGRTLFNVGDGSASLAILHCLPRYSPIVVDRPALDATLAILKWKDQDRRSPPAFGGLWKGKREEAHLGRGLPIRLMITLVIVVLITVSTGVVVTSFYRTSSGITKELIKEKAELVNRSIVERVSAHLTPVTEQAVFAASLLGRMDRGPPTDAQVGALLFAALAASLLAGAGRPRLPSATRAPQSDGATIRPTRLERRSRLRRHAKAGLDRRGSLLGPLLLCGTERHHLLELHNADRRRRGREARADLQRVPGRAIALHRGLSGCAHRDRFHPGRSRPRTRPHKSGRTLLRAERPAAAAGLDGIRGCHPRIDLVARAADEDRGRSGQRPTGQGAKPPGGDLRLPVSGFGRLTMRRPGQSAAT